MNRYDILVDGIWRDIQKTELELRPEPKEDIVIYMSRGLLYASVSWLRHLIYYHGADRPWTIFGREIVPTYEPGLTYAVGIRRRMDFLREADADGAEGAASEATP